MVRSFTIDARQAPSENASSVVGVVGLENGRLGMDRILFDITIGRMEICSSFGSYDVMKLCHNQKRCVSSQ